MKDLNLDYLNKEDYLKYKKIMETFFLMIMKKE